MHRLIVNQFDIVILPGGGGALAIFVYGGVQMEGQIQTQKYGFTENFAKI